MDGGERVFKANFTGDGVALLQERVKEKLQELMGDYSDDTLAEYVVVLLRNGRCKDEAAKELQVFLGDDNVRFISWLWDHLSSNMHLYVQPKAITTNIDAKNGHGTARGFPVQNKSSHDILTGSGLTDHEPEAETKNTTRVLQKREWGGIVREESEAVPLRSVIADFSQAEERTFQKSHAVRRSRSPGRHHQRKRNRGEDARPSKRVSNPVIDAPRRLLQFAVRDAVRTVQPMASRSESASKRLRSVVSTLAPDSADDFRLHKMSSDIRMPHATAAFRAAAEAAEDVLRGRSCVSVFNRLSGRRAMDTAKESSDFREQDPEEEEYEDVDNVGAKNQEGYHERSQYDDGDASMFDRETEEAVNSASDTDGYGNTRVIRHCGLVSPRNTLHSSEDRGLLMSGYGIEQGTAVVRNRRLMDQDSPESSVPRTSGKLVNTYGNVNTWNPPNHETPRNAGNIVPQIPVEKIGTDTGRLNVRLACVNNTPLADKSKVLVHSSSLVEAHKASPVPVAGPYSTGQPQGDVDSRTVFVSNVHFAATKDALSCHFNKFGVVLKVVILSDVATGQPTGSAYIEFMHKESAEQALSLNGTSFMSRILKVVRRSSPDVPQLPGWPSAARGSPLSSRLIRTAYPRPMFPGAMRGRFPLRAGARSLQWKRDAADSAGAGKPSPSTPAPPGNQLVSPTARSFTYTRAEPKPNDGATI